MANVILQRILFDANSKIVLGGYSSEIVGAKKIAIVDSFAQGVTVSYSASFYAIGRETDGVMEAEERTEDAAPFITCNTVYTIKSDECEDGIHFVGTIERIIITATEERFLSPLQKYARQRVFIPPASPKSPLSPQRIKEWLGFFEPASQQTTLEKYSQEAHKLVSIRLPYPLPIYYKPYVDFLCDKIDGLVTKLDLLSIVEETAQSCQYLKKVLQQKHSYLNTLFSNKDDAKLICVTQAYSEEHWPNVAGKQRRRIVIRNNENAAIEPSNNAKSLVCGNHGNPAYLFVDGYGGCFNSITVPLEMEQENLEEIMKLAALQALCFGWKKPVFAATTGEGRSQITSLINVFNTQWEEFSSYELNNGNCIALLESHLKFLDGELSSDSVPCSPSIDNC